MRILYLDLDTLRPDHLGCYGYHRNTSPNMDRLAAEGTRFDDYYCTDAPCLPSRTALVSGRFGIHTGVVNHGGTNAEMRIDGPERGFNDTMGRESLWSFINHDLNLHTVSISPFAERHGTWCFYAGFREMYNTGKCGMESAEEVTPTALDWINRNAAGDDWFLQLNYWDPHGPYRAPEEFGNPFADEPLPEWLTEEVVTQHQNVVGPHCALEIAMYNDQVPPDYPRYPGKVTDIKGARQIIDGYDCGIRYMDDHIGQILDALENQGVLDDTIIIISSDHGENQGELGIYVEHGTADYITTRIPMIIRWPGMPKGQVDSGLHYNLDLGPTLAEMCGKEPKPSWDGQSYASAIKGKGECGRDYLVVSQCAHICQRSVRFGEWMYMRTYHDGYRLFPKEMLFNIVDDPHEQNNLAEAHPDICKEAVYLLNEWHDEMMATMDCDVDPLWTVIGEGGPLHAKGQLAEYCKYLEKTGRGWAIPELRKRHPQEFIKTVEV